MFALGHDDVSCDVPTGFVVVHVNVTLHVPAFAAIVQDGFAGVSVPVCAAANDGRSAISETASNVGAPCTCGIRDRVPKGTRCAKLFIRPLVAVG